MFRKTKVNTVESSEGFSVQVMGRTGILYRENGRTMKIDSEVQVDPVDMVVYVDSIIKWDAPFENVLVENNEKLRIVDNIRRAFEFQQHVVLFE